MVTLHSKSTHDFENIRIQNLSIQFYMFENIKTIVNPNVTFCILTARGMELRTNVTILWFETLN